VMSMLVVDLAVVVQGEENASCLTMIDDRSARTQPAARSSQ